MTGRCLRAVKRSQLKLPETKNERRNLNPLLRRTVESHCLFSHEIPFDWRLGGSLQQWNPSPPRLATFFVVLVVHIPSMFASYFYTSGHRHRPHWRTFIENFRSNSAVEVTLGNRRDLRMRLDYNEPITCMQERPWIWIVRVVSKAGIFTDYFSVRVQLLCQSCRELWNRLFTSKYLEHLDQSRLITKRLPGDFEIIYSGYSQIPASPYSLH